MAGDITSQILARLVALEDEVRRLATNERNIDKLTLRDGVTAPTAVVGYAFIYVDGTSGDLSIRYGDNVTKVIVADT